MANGVFTTRISPTYDDLPEERYHFPQAYLNQVKETVGEWIVYYEPRRQDARDGGRAGRQSYFAIACVTGIRPDTELPGHFYADVADYLEFIFPVPFRIGTTFFESGLAKDDGTTNRGAFGRSVRIISKNEFGTIVTAGFNSDYSLDSTTGILNSGMAEAQTVYERPILEHLVRRPFRDAAFSRKVSDAYGQTCALTGLKIINGGGRAEIEAAHIRPVGNDHRGPDSVRNGIALSRTVHWMFDRGLLSIADDYKILRSPVMPEDAGRLLNPDGQVRLPESGLLRPHPQFLRYHRDNIFKQ